MLKMISFFINRPKLVNLLLIFIIISGLLTLRNTQKQGAPSVDYGAVTIVTLYPGASPEDVELDVTNKIEAELEEIDGIKEIQSQSLENYSVISITLDDNHDYEEAKDDIRKAVDQVDDLPEEVKGKPKITEANSDRMPLIEVAITGKADYALKKKYAKALENKFRANSLVGSVGKYGYYLREIKVEVDQAKLISNYISIGELMNAVEAHNFRMSAGDLSNNDIEKKFVVMSEFQKLTDVNKVIVRSGFEGNRVLVSDVAKVIDGYREPEIAIRTDAEKSINLVVTKKPGADIIKAAKQNKKIFNEFKESLPEDIQARLVVDYSVQTRNLLELVVDNAKIGLILVVVSLILLLNFKVAFWTALGIPVSILLAFSFFPLFGLTINFISLFAIIIVLGMIVDDAIIVGENIYYHREMGLSSVEAAKKGVGEVLYPVITTVMTTIIVFMPMLFMKGVMGKYMFQMPIVVGLILIASLAEALFILPSHISHIKIKPRKENKKHIMNHLEDAYEKFTEFTVRYRLLTTLFFMVVFVLSIFIMVTQMKFMLFPSDDGMFGYIMYETPKGTELEKTGKLSSRIEEKLSPYMGKYISHYVNTVGEKEPFLVERGSNYKSSFAGNIMLHLTPMKDRDLISREIVSRIKKDLEDVKGFKSINVDIVSDGPPVGRPITVTLMSNDDETRGDLARDLKQYLKEQDGVFNIEANENQGKKQIIINFDYELMSRLGLNALTVANTIRAAFEGVVVTDVRWEDESVEYRVILNQESRSKIETLQSLTIKNIRALTVRNQQGKLIPLGQFINTQEKDDLLKINHFDSDRSITIFADVDADKITSAEINRSIKQKFGPIFRSYPDLRVKFGGEEADTEEAMASLFAALILALLGIYFILVILFNNFMQPFLVMTAIPFSLVGVIVAFFVHGMPISFPAIVGLIGLTGVVVNDSLVMISFLNNKKNEVDNVLTEKDIASAAKRRLRPIFITTATTAAGLFPTAYQFGGNNPMIVPMIMTIAWGLIFATVISLVLIPSLYYIHYRFTMKVQTVCKDGYCRLTSKFSESTS